MGDVEQKWTNLNVVIPIVFNYKTFNFYNLLFENLQIEFKNLNFRLYQMTSILYGSMLSFGAKYSKIMSNS